MKKIKISTCSKKLLADVFTPVGIYLRLRDRFRDTILLESSDYNSAENSYSLIGINAIAGIEISNLNEIELKYPNKEPKRIIIKKSTKIPDELWDFMQTFQLKETAPIPVNLAQGLFGYTSYDALQFFENINFKEAGANEKIIENKHSSMQKESVSLNLFSDHSVNIPLIRYRLYQYIIIINHFRSELFICENQIKGIDGDVGLIESIIRSKDIPAYPFSTGEIKTTSLDNEGYKTMLKKGIESCTNREISRIFLSREYAQKFAGDEFNVYRTLRNVSPGPYLFYFDYGDYRIFGSGNGIPLESGEKMKVLENPNPFGLLVVNFPAGTMSSAPKREAIAVINQLEIGNRGYYGGSVGFVGFDGSINHAVMVRAFLSKNGHLAYRAGARVTISSDVDKELQKVTDELNMLTQAIELAGEFN